MPCACKRLDPSYQIPDALWERVQPLLPLPKTKKKAGSPRMDDRRAMMAIVYLLRTGCQWKALPRCLDARSTVHDRYQEWRRAGVFQRMWQDALEQYDDCAEIEWQWQVLDGAMAKAPLGGKDKGRNPTDRGKSDTKRSLLTDGKVSRSAWS